jgi:hypothetical protein
LIEPGEGQDGRGAQGSHQRAVALAQLQMQPYSSCAMMTINKKKASIQQKRSFLCKKTPQTYVVIAAPKTTNLPLTSFPKNFLHKTQGSEYDIVVYRLLMCS